jgi:hypothetical protein
MTAGEFTWSTYDTLLRLDFVSFAQRDFRELSPRGALLMSWHIETVGNWRRCVKASSGGWSSMWRRAT